MKKIFIHYVTDCEYCPACTTDANIVRLECRRKQGRTIRYISDNKPIIPDWCPLKDIKE